MYKQVEYLGSIWGARETVAKIMQSTVYTRQ